MLMPEDHPENDWSTSNTALFRVRAHLTVCLIPDLRVLAECLLPDEPCFFTCQGLLRQYLLFPQHSTPWPSSCYHPSHCAWLIASSLEVFLLSRS